MQRTPGLQAENPPDLERSFRVLCAEHCPWVDLPGQLWDAAQERALRVEFDESPLCCIPEMFLQHVPVLSLLLSGPSGGVWCSSVVLWSVQAAL